MPDSTTIIAAGLTAGYALTLLYVSRRSRERQNAGMRHWLMLTLVAALAGAVLLFLPRDAHTDTRYEALFVKSLTQPALAIIVSNLMLVLFGAYTLRYLGSRLVSAWMVVGIRFTSWVVCCFWSRHLSASLSFWQSISCFPRPHAIWCSWVSMRALARGISPARTP